MPEPANFRQVNFVTFLEDDKITQRKMLRRPEHISPAHFDTFATKPELYRRRGMLETFGYEPLPRTSITQAARARLSHIGCNDQRIEAIRELTASFRYDGVGFKLQRLEQYPIPTLEHAGQYSCSLPNVVDVQGTLMGQCSDLAAQWILQANLSNLFADLPTLVEFGIFYGQSPTHFCLPAQNHVWNSIDFDDPVTKQPESVYVDAALQLICTPEESLYYPKDGQSNVTSLTSQLWQRLKITEVDLQNREFWHSRVRENWVLGVDPERNFAYGVCAFVDPHLPGPATPSLYIPALKRYSVSGAIDFLFTNPLSGEIEWSNRRGKLSDLDEYTREYLELIQKLHFTQTGPDFLPNSPFALTVAGSSIEWNTR